MDLYTLPDAVKKLSEVGCKLQTAAIDSTHVATAAVRCVHRQIASVCLLYDVRAVAIEGSALQKEWYLFSFPDSAQERHNTRLCSLCSATIDLWDASETNTCPGSSLHFVQ